jgi:hypothetical protein
VATGSRGRAEQRHRDVAGQSIVALEGAMVTRHGRMEAVKSAADEIRPGGGARRRRAAGSRARAPGLPLPGREHERSSGCLVSTCGEESEL